MDLRKRKVQTYHGRNNTREYTHWAGMKSKCVNPKNKSYKHVGAKGIKVCKEWEEDFMAFYRDMGDIPKDAKSVCRKDINKDFNKKNCYWGGIQMVNVNLPG